MEFCRATLVRFLFGLPFSVLFVLIAVLIGKKTAGSPPVRLPTPTP